MQSSVDAVKPGSPSVGIRQTVQAFPPVYFAMVMATGIVSIAVYLHGMQRLAATLMWLNVVLFIAFWILLTGRLALCRHCCVSRTASYSFLAYRHLGVPRTRHPSH
jgi:tellurite resistance protein TehA-like permease